MIEHCALLYHEREELLEGVARFVQPGIEAGETVLVALPADRLKPLRARLGAGAAAIELLDMGEAGRNPGRLIPAFHERLEAGGGRTIHLVGEPIWAARSAGEIREAIRHEALVNRAFAGDVLVRALCPFDAATLPRQILADIRRTHPLVMEHGARTWCPEYDGRVPGSCCAALPDPVAPVATLAFAEGDLPAVRALVREKAAAARIPLERAEDFVLAVDEAATNSIRHAGEHGGRLRVWREGGTLTCEISDDGRIADPLAGRRRQAAREDGGRGLWLIHHLCDLVETRTGPGGTVLRLHARLR